MSDDKKTNEPKMFSGSQVGPAVSHPLGYGASQQAGQTIGYASQSTEQQHSPQPSHDGDGLTGGVQVHRPASNNFSNDQLLSKRQLGLEFFSSIRIGTVISFILAIVTLTAASADISEVLESIASELFSVRSTIDE